MASLSKLLLGAALALPTTANAVAIDFDGLDASSGQDVPLMSFSEDGYTFNLSSSGNNAGPAIFDTTCNGYGPGCNGDADLQPTPQGENGVSGNVLVLQEGGSNTVPDDDASGGTIDLTLDSGTPFFFTGASAVDDGEFTFSTSKDGNLGSISLASDNETGMTTFGSSLIEVGDTISVGYSQSGGVDSLTLAPIPVPAAFPLFLTAIGGLGFASRRRRTAAA